MKIFICTYHILCLRIIIHLKRHSFHHKNDIKTWNSLMLVPKTWVSSFGSFIKLTELPCTGLWVSQRDRGPHKQPVLLPAVQSLLCGFNPTGQRLCWSCSGPVLRFWWSWGCSGSIHLGLHSASRGLLKDLNEVSRRTSSQTISQQLE